MYQEGFDERQPSISATRIGGQRLGSAKITDPINYPEFISDGGKVKRAWVLLLLTFLAPGSVQLISDRKTLGKRALTATICLWLALAALVILWFIRRTFVLWLFTSNLFLLCLTCALIVLALGWLFIFFDTLRIIQVRYLPSKARTPLIFAMLAMLIMVTGSLGYGSYLANTGRGALGNVFADGTQLEEVDGRYNILLMGGDAGADRVGRRPDSMTVFSIDANTGQAVTISVPRNTQNAIFSADSPLWQVYPEGFNCGDECIINALYTDVTQNYSYLYPQAADPGAEATMDAVSGVLGLEIHNYVLIDMSGFEQLVDALGGITIDVGGYVPIGGGTDLVTGLKNPIDGYIEPGIQKLDGYHALWYARSREGASDYDRQARQRCVQAAMLKQLDPYNVLTKFADITAAGEQVIETNIPQDSLSGLADIALKSKNFELVQYAAGPPYYEDLFPTYPDFDQLHSDVARVIEDSKNGITPSGSADAAGFLATGQRKQSQPFASSISIETVSELTDNGTCSVP